jgi:Tfp pilus assembly protein PilF
MHYAIGIAYWAQNQLDLAKSEFSQALQENAEDALTNLYLGDIAVHQQRFADALGFLKVAEKGQPRMAQVHVLLGKSYEGQADFEKARTELLAAIECDPTAAQPHYVLAQIYRKLHQPEASANELAQFQALSKDSGKAP